MGSSNIPEPTMPNDLPEIMDLNFQQPNIIIAIPLVVPAILNFVMPAPALEPDYVGIIQEALGNGQLLNNEALMLLDAIQGAHINNLVGEQDFPPESGAWVVDENGVIHP